MLNENLKMKNHTLIDESCVLLPAYFIRDGRLQFRKAFIKNYPSFIYLLRSSIPQVTAGEEILCMLIFLRQSTDDISAILGICRKSVKQSRYRLRQKLNISANLSLEEFVYKLIPDD